ncbi:MAG: ATP-binding protein [Methanosarcinales archaeon]|nr:ATP-binding protein [Methanosarcinales archaeon]
MNIEQSVNGEWNIIIWKVSKDSATLFFQLMSRIYEHGSIMLNSNRPFEEYGSLLNYNVILPLPAILGSIKSYESGSKLVGKRGPFSTAIFNLTETLISTHKYCNFKPEDLL